MTLKKVKGAKGYQVKISYKKTFKKKTTIKKNIKSTKEKIKLKKSFAKKKKLYLKARAYKVVDKKKKYGKWCKAKKIKMY